MPNCGGTIVVTGAGSGIGQAVAAYLEERGKTVVRLDRNGSEGVAPFDVCDEAAWGSLSSEHVTGLVHAAGVRSRAPLAETLVDDFRTVMDVNVTGTFLALRWAARRPPESGPLSVVTLSSAVAERPPEHQLAYNASKAAINLLTRSAANELARAGVRVNALAPGSVRTPMTEAGWADESHSVRMRREIPLARPGEPQEVAAAVAFLLSDASSYMTGSVLTLDGGWTA